MYDKRVTRCWPAPFADSGNHRQRKEQHELSGARMDIAKLSGFVVGKAVYFGCCISGLELQIPLHREKALPAPGCDEHPFIDLKSQFNPIRVSVRYFPIDPIWTAFCRWSIQKWLIEVYNSSQPKYFCWIQEAKYLFKMPFQNCLQTSPL